MARHSLADHKTEAFLMTCTDEFRREIRRGADPTEALYKVASSHNLQPDQIRLIGRIYNTAATRALQKVGSDLFERAGATRICNPEEVIERIYGALGAPGEKLPALVEKAARAAAEAEAEKFYKDAAHKVIMIIGRGGEEPGAAMPARVHGDLPACPMKLPAPPDHVFDLMRAKMRRMMELLSEPLAEVGDQIAALKPPVRDNVIETIRVIHGPGFKAIIRQSTMASPHIQRPFLDEPPSDLFDRVREIAEAFDRAAEAKAKLREVEETPKAKERKEKEEKKAAAAMLGSVVSDSTDIFGRPSPYRLLQRMLDKAASDRSSMKKAKEAIRELMLKHAEESERAIDEAAREAAREDDDREALDRDPFGKEAVSVVGFPPALLTAINSSSPVTIPKPVVKPSVLNKIRQIQTESLIQMWKETDDVIRNFTDSEIMAAVNELLQTFPGLPMRPAYFRAALRTYLTTGYLPLSMPTYDEPKIKDEEGGGGEGSKK